VIIRITITQISVIITTTGTPMQGSTLNLKAGDVVNAIMTNMDNRPHCWAIATQPDGTGRIMFDAEIGAARPLNPGETGSDTFTITQPGNFYYICPASDSICSELSGRVTVMP
jgi:plastocyanin